MINYAIDTFKSVFNIPTECLIKNRIDSPYKNEYDSCELEIKNYKIIYRTAKITPKKPGAFVAIWKKDPSNRNIPFAMEDDLTHMVIYVEENHNKGVFIFTKQDLAALQIISHPTSKGKMGIRLYPIWSENLNPQASKSKDKQSPFFYIIRNL